MKRRAAMLVIALPVAVMLAALWRQYAPPDRDLAFPTGQIIIGIDGSFPPFAHDEGGTLSGIDIDLGRAIAKEIGLPVRFVNIGYYALYDALISSQVDLLAAGLRIDPARMDAVRYSDPYFDNGYVLVSAADSAIKPSDLKGRAVSFEYASPADSLTREWAAEQAIKRMPYELPSHALEALRIGQADAALVDVISLRQYAQKNAQWGYQRQFVTREPYAIALRKDRLDAWKLLRSALATLKDSGKLARILETWL